MQQKPDTLPSILFILLQTALWQWKKNVQA